MNIGQPSTAEVTVRETDTAVPQVLFNSPTVPESVGTAPVQAVLSHPYPFPITVNYQTADGSAHFSGSPGDYTPISSGTLSFPANDPTTHTLGVNIINDSDAYEPPEYFFVSAAGNANVNYLYNTYSDLLFRPADQGGVTGWSGALASGMYRTTVARLFQATIEYAAAVVDRFYQHYLFRQADPGGKEFWTAQVLSVASVTPEVLIGKLAGSSEYFQSRAGSNNGTFVQMIYYDILGRQASPQEQASWLSQLRPQGTMTGEQVATAIAKSQEYYNNSVSAGYQRYLHRTPTSSEVSSWSNLLVNQQIRSEDMVAGLVGSQEYSNNLFKSTGTVTITDNQPPQVTTPPNQHNWELDSVSLPIIASEPEGESLTYTVTNLPGGLGYSSTTGLISGTIANGAAGTYTVTVQVSDSQAAPVSVQFTWTVWPLSATQPAGFPDPAMPDTCGCERDVIGTAQGAPSSADGPTSGFANGTPVRYADGVVEMDSSRDVTSAGFGIQWGLDRSWTNGAGYATNSFNGSGMVVSQLPHLLQDSTGTHVAVVSNGINARFFDLASGVYYPRYYLQEALSYDAGHDLFILNDTAGQVLQFFGFSWPVNKRGQFWSLTDPYGNLTQVISWTTPDGKPTEVQRSVTSGGQTTIESFAYAYIASGVNAGLMSSVTLRREIVGGSWTTIRQAIYSYGDGTTATPYANVGDLQLVQVEDAAGNILDTSYYRYYTGEAGGNIHDLKYYFSPESYARMAAALGNPLGAIDQAVSPYADDFLQYDTSNTSNRVSKIVIQGQGEYDYNYGSTSTFGNGVNIWKYQTTETLSDGSQYIAYANYLGEIMALVFADGSGKQWPTYYKYDSQGRLILTALPSAVTRIEAVTPDLVNGGSDLNSTGMIETTDYYPTTTAGEGTPPGGVAGYEQDTKIQQGVSGTPILQSSTQYSGHSANGYAIYVPANDTVYQNTDASGAETTSYSYTWFPGTLQVQSIKVTLPLVIAAHNGPGTLETETSFFDIYGNEVSHKDGDGFTSSWTYDLVTGAVVQSTDDAGGLNLTTQITVDALARPIKVVDPKGNITYYLYNDPLHEVLTYRGWNVNTSMPTGPTEVTREDRAHSYLETFTMSAAPHLTNGGLPDGTESVANLQSLSRTFVNNSGQVAETDDYFNLSNVTYSNLAYLGAAGANYYATFYGYDVRGRQNHEVNPTGTITNTTYDALGRVTGTSVGTSAGMVQVRSEIYDNGLAGDSNLTEEDAYPGGGAAWRISKFYYDWRDRQVASKDGWQGVGSEGDGTHRPIVVTTYDNLDEATSQAQYDGDNVSITVNNGVLQPLAANLLRAYSTTQYDDQGRVYATNVFSVDQSSGAVSATSLTTGMWYDHRGHVIKTSEPGGLVYKYQYDGAGREIVSYVTDGGGDVTWLDAGNVVGDNVLTQVETQYDADGNAILVTTRQRNHDETATGKLGNASTTPKARVSYAAAYYDAVNRLTATIDVGTDPSNAPPRPVSPPPASDTVLVTSYGYQGDNVQQVQLTGLPTGGTFTLAYGGQTTAAIAYNAGSAAVQSALQALSSIGTGNVLVAGGPGGPWQVRFAGALAGTPLAALTANGAGLTGGTSPSVAVTVTSLGGDAGRLQQVTDPRGIVTKTDYDWLGRTVRTVEAFVAFNPSSNADKTTEYTYDGDGHVLTLTADEPNGAGETTKYVYGVTQATGSDINSNDILAAVVYPDTNTGRPPNQPGPSQEDSYTVNALGETKTATDRNGNVHTYAYDVLGRLIADGVTTLGNGVDGAVRRIEIAYDTGGRPYRYTSFDAPTGGNIVNQVQRNYNGLGQLMTEYQSHASAVNTSSTPVVGYGYSQMAGGQNNSRLTSLYYPNGRLINYNYNPGLDSTISRLSSISDNSGGTILESYKYLGLDTVVERDHPENNVNLSYISPTGSPGPAGDQYTGLDSFGRIVDQTWYKANGGVTDSFQYGYDRDGNVLYKKNSVSPSYSELYHASGANNGYDPLNQLTGFVRGVLSQSSQGGPFDTVLTPSTTKSWNLDALGNWTGVTTNGTTQNRTANQQNELTAVGPASLSFDTNGNTLVDERGQQYSYDAWNRLVKVVNNNGATLATYSYDALGRRIVENEGSGARDLYYSSAWQVLEERVSGVAKVQYVWSPVYVDALVERDRDVNNNSTWSERLYVQQDANWNVTALVDTLGSVKERYIYDPYGQVQVLNPDWTLRGSSQYAWNYLHQGGRFDWTTGLYNFRNRDYSPTLGRWLQADPLGFAAGDSNVYRDAGNSPVSALDPTGLEQYGQHWVPFAIMKQYRQFLSDDAVRAASGAFSGPLVDHIHRYEEINGVKHPRYSEAVGEQLVGYMKKKGIMSDDGKVLRQMTKTEMKEFARFMEEGRDFNGDKLPARHDIPKYNSGIRKMMVDPKRSVRNCPAELLVDQGNEYLRKNKRRAAGLALSGALAALFLPGIGDFAAAATNESYMNKFKSALQEYANGNFTRGDSILAGDEGSLESPLGGLHMDISNDHGIGGKALADRLLQMVKTQRDKAMAAFELAPSTPVAANQANWYPTGNWALDWILYGLWFFGGGWARFGR